MKLLLGIIAVLLLFLFTGWLVSFPLKVRKYRLVSRKVNAPVRIAVVSDLHSTRYGKRQRRLIRKLSETHCDLIALPGDIIDDIKPLAGADEFLAQCSQLAPCFYCTGNHENIEKLMTLPQIKAHVRSFGITVLDGKKRRVLVNGNPLLVCGVDDPRKFHYTDRSRQEENVLMRQLGRMQGREELTILLAHRPERAELYARYGFDCILSGHAHGGQVRIPGLINGLFAPNQGLFPKRAGGRYATGNSTLIVSRGCCQRWFLPRLFNPPEIPVIDIVPDTDDE